MIGRGWSVVCDDARNWLSWTKEGQLDSIVTSPPYGKGMRYAHDYNAVKLEDYKDWSSEWMHYALKAVKPGGLLALNLGRRFKDNSMLTYHWDAVSAARDVGWMFIDEFIWYKPNANPFKGRLATDAHEYVFIFATSYPFYEGGPDELRKPYASDTANRYQRKFDNHGVVKGVKNSNSHRKINPKGARGHSVLQHGIGGRRGQTNPHPAPMSMRLAEDLVKLTCPEGGTVGDPFCGSATTGIAALMNGRKFLGCDADERWAKLSMEYMNQLELVLANEGV